MTYFKPAALQKFILKLLMEVFRNEDENSVLFIFAIMFRSKSSRDFQALDRFIMTLIFIKNTANKLSTNFQSELWIKTIQTD